MRCYDSGSVINIGCGEDLTIRALAELIAKVVGFRGAIKWDLSKLDGTPRKLLDISRLRALDWQPRIALAEGIKQTYAWFPGTVWSHPASEVPLRLRAVPPLGRMRHSLRGAFRCLPNHSSSSFVASSNPSL